jgi:Pectate lyase superfamily protein/Secretion system C-terminal sorting domain
MKSLKLLFIVAFFLVSNVFVAQNVVFPANSGVINVKLPPYNAVGDGVTDDTQAILSAITTNWNYCGGAANNFRYLYIPNGTYLVSNEIFFQRWLTFQGQSETGTIIKLKNNCPGYQDINNPKAVVRTRFLGNSCSPSDGDNNSSFSNYIQNLTVDTGNGNPGAIGIRYSNHNSGAIRNVTIKSTGVKGVKGLDLAETEFGPGLIRDVTIDNFKLGIITPGAPSHATFENITVKNCNRAMENFLPLSINGFNSINNDEGIFNGSYSRLAQLVLINATFSGGLPNKFAIENTEQGTVCLRNVVSSGFQSVLIDRGTVTPENTIGEYITGDKVQTFVSIDGHLKLPIENPPIPFEENITNWVAITPGEDATIQIQTAIDNGAQTIYFPFANYTISNTIFIRNNLRRIVGMQSNINANLNSFNSGTKPMFVFQNTQSVSVEFLRMQQFPQSIYKCAVIDTNQTVFFKSCAMSVASSTYGFISNTANATNGKLFLEDTPEETRPDFPMNVWMRHWNPENNPATATSTRVYGTNKGGNWWILGMKTEATATHLVTTNGGKSEILGGFFRDQVTSSTVPLFNTTDSCITATFFTYDFAGCGNARSFFASETRQGVTNNLIFGPCEKIVGLYSGCSQTLSNEEFESNFSSIKLYPNPTFQNATLEYNLSENSQISIAIYDIIGKEVLKIANEFQNIGNYKININTSKMQSGIYFVKVNSNKFQTTKRLIVE